MTTNRNGKPATRAAEMDYTRLPQRDLGKFLPSHFQRVREGRMEAIYQERRTLCRAAVEQACVSSKRDNLARKMHLGEAFTVGDWPALDPLTPGERTAVIAEIHRVFGTTPKRRA